MENSISNWSMFGTRSVMIVLHKYEHDDEVLYQPAISFSLNDGNEESEDVDEQKYIDIFLDIFEECRYCASREVASRLLGMFDNICDKVLVIGSDGNPIDEEDLSLTDILNEEDEEDNEDDFVPVKTGSNKPTVH